MLTYEYDAAHNLKLTKDPLNRPFQTLTYEDGRLATVTDALGNEVEIDVDPDARTETVTDAEGRLRRSRRSTPAATSPGAREIYDGKTAITTYHYDSVRQRQDPDRS